MATNKHVNENYIHNCGLPQVKISSKIRSISEMGFEAEETIKILNFYLLFAPTQKPSKKKDPFGICTLSEYGWVGASAMSKLEGLLLKSSGIGVFCLLKSDSIEKTLNAMNLNDSICTEHPRAVMRQRAKVTLHEDGSTEVLQQETRMECLFRHMRNSLAHNQTYLFDNDNIMLEDKDDNGKISARIIMPRSALLTWIDIVKKSGDKQI